MKVALTSKGINLRFADDTVLITDSEIKLEALLDNVIIQSEKMALILNEKKLNTKLSANENATGGTYLEILITQNGKCDD